MARGSVTVHAWLCKEVAGWCYYLNNFCGIGQTISPECLTLGVSCDAGVTRKVRAGLKGAGVQGVGRLGSPTTAAQRVRRQQVPFSLP